MRFERLSGFLAVLALVVVTPAAFAQTRPTPSGDSPTLNTTISTGKITGRVTEKGQPVQFANVIVLGTKQGIATDENGRFTIAGVPVGAAKIQVQATGYDKVVKDVQVNAGATV